MNAQLQLSEDATLVDGVIVIEYDGHMTYEARERLRDMALQAWPNRKVVILDGGLRIGFTQERMDRIEDKVDRILRDMVRRPPSGCGPF